MAYSGVEHVVSPKQVNPTSKITIISVWKSHDKDTTFVWNVTSEEGSRDIVLEYGLTISTPATNEYLVILPNVLNYGRSYTFYIIATNSYGHSHMGSVNITTTILPYGGAFKVGHVIHLDSDM